MKPIERLSVITDNKTIGELGISSHGKIYFQYDPAWLETGFDLSPGTMPFNSALQLSPEPDLFDGLHGVFNDSLPDGWGLLLMDRALRGLGLQANETTPLDRLAYIGSRAMGALEYEPKIECGDSAEELNIAQLAQSADRLLHGETPDVLQQLQIHGGSPGGARPKVTVALSTGSDLCLSGHQPLPDGYQHWIVKFRAKEDPIDIGRTELAYARMAKIAGIDMPECQLLTVGRGSNTDEFFAVRRFDRVGDVKQHMVSLSGYVYASHRLPSIDYETIIKATHNISRSVVEAEKAFRLMVFNVLAHNKDDHSKNFAFIRHQNNWVLAPGFDLTFNSGINNQHTSDIAGSGNPNLQDIEGVARNCGISNWRSIVDEVRHAIVQWNDIAAAENVSATTIRNINNALVDIRKRHF